MAGRVRIGISGWTYAPWRGRFYPARLPRSRELQYAAEQFSTIEINGTFYSLQRPTSFQKWAAATPPDFVFAVKGSRYITHMRRLREGTRQALANLYASGLLELGDKLGPMLWQFPPNLRYDEELFENFLSMLPRDGAQAAQLAHEHDTRLSGARLLIPKASRRPRLRHAFEVRHASFVNERFIRLLRRHNVALVCADTVEWPRLMDVTADFVYVRLHGSEVLYTSGYDVQELDTWAHRIVTWARGGEVNDGDHAAATHARRRATRDVFVYFDNDVKVLAPVNARDLAARVDSLLGRD